MVDVGRLSFQLDYQGFRRDVQRMRFELDKLKRDARDVQQSMGGIGIGAAGARGAGRIGTPGAGALGGGGGGGGSFVGGVAAGRVGGGIGLGPLAGILGGVGVVAGIRSMVEAAANLELQLAQVKAVSGATADQLKELEEAALDAGASTRFTAGEAAGGLLELARAGLKAEQQIKSLRPTLDLATAGLLSVSESADLVTNVAAQFQLPADQIRRIGDSLVAVSNNTNTTVAQLGQALKDVGVVSSEFGLSLEDTVGALGALAAAGLKGSDAAIKMRQALIRLSDPNPRAIEELERLGLSIEDVNVQALGFERVLRNIGNARVDIRSAARLVESRNAQALTILSRNAAEGFRGNRDAALGGTGSAARVAEERSATLKGSFDQLRSATEILYLEFNKATGSTKLLQQGIEGLTGFFRDAAATIREGRESPTQRGFDGPNRQAEIIREGLSGSRPSNEALIQLARDSELTRQEIDQLFPGLLDWWRQRVRSGAAPVAATVPLADGDTLAARRLAAAGSSPPARAGFAGVGIGPGVPGGFAYTGRRESEDVYGPPGLLPSQQERGNRLADVTSFLQEEITALRMARTEREAYYLSVQAGVDLRSEEGESIRAMVGELQRLERINAVSEGIGQGISQISAAWLFAADSAEEATRRILESISQLAVQEFALQPLANAISGIASNVLGSFNSSSNTGRPNGAGAQG